MAPSELQNYLSKTISRDNWLELGYQKRAGVLIPLFSVYSKDSYGVGDLGDLKLVIDWAASTGNSIVQLLPMNEMGGLFCPYDALSSFALEPAYICLKDFAELSGKKCRSCADPAYVDYSIKEEKVKLLWEVFLATDLSEETDFEQFQSNNSYWLSDFAFFKVLKEQHQGKPWYEWDEPLRDRNPEALRRFQQSNIEKITFQMWLQWVLHKQFQGARSYAAQNNVFLKGDLPVLVSRDSADVWSHRDFFKLDFAAGAPPDMYAAKGQRWGMPTYNWENIASDNYRYLKEKLKYAQEFYSVLRVDHVVGLLRIWSIPYLDPPQNQGLNGSFDPPEEHAWGAHGRAILSVMLRSTKMLLCAEDLGTIPPACTQLLLELGICGNEVQRWVKDWRIRHDFLPPQEYRELAVVMLSTHDTTNWKAWWQYEAGTVDAGLFMRKCADRKIDFESLSPKLFDPARSLHGRLRWKEEIDSLDKLLWELGKPKEQVGDFIELYQNTFGEKEKLWKLLGCLGQFSEAAGASLLARAMDFILRSRSVFCINSIRDYLSLGDIFKGDPYQYRVNVPGTISPKNWSLRLPLSLEELLRHPVNAQIRQMIRDSQRI